MKLLWASNSPWASSGYGQTTARYTPRLKALGHDVAIFANFGLHGAPLEWNGIPVYPRVSDAWGNDVISAVTLHHFKGKRDAGWLIYLQDVWTVTSSKIKELHTAAWAPVDHSPAPPAVVNFFKRAGAVPIAMSLHGQRMYEQAGLRPLYVPHGTDTALFRPVDARKRMRAKLGIPQDAYCFGMIANNNGTAHPSRKAFPETLAAFKQIHDRHPDAHIYLHCQRDKLFGGMEFDPLLKDLELPEDSYSFVNQFDYSLGLIGTEEMPAVYSAIDCLVNPSMGEGFGMPIIEAQACEIPVILADNTAMSDLCGAGWLIPSYPEWDGFQQAYWGRIRVEELTQAMEEAYTKGQGPRPEGREFVLQNYEVDATVRDHWVPALATLQRMLHAPEAKPVDLAALDV